MRLCGGLRFLRDSGGRGSIQDSLSADPLGIQFDLPLLHNGEWTEIPAVSRQSIGGD